MQYRLSPPVPRWASFVRRSHPDPQHSGHSLPRRLHLFRCPHRRRRFKILLLHPRAARQRNPPNLFLRRRPRPQRHARARRRLRPHSLAFQLHWPADRQQPGRGLRQRQRQCLRRRRHRILPGRLPAPAITRRQLSAGSDAICQRRRRANPGRRLCLHRARVLHSGPGKSRQHRFPGWGREPAEPFLHAGAAGRHLLPGTVAHQRADPALGQGGRRLHVSVPGHRRHLALHLDADFGCTARRVDAVRRRTSLRYPNRLRHLRFHAPDQ